MQHKVSLDKGTSIRNMPFSDLMQASVVQESRAYSYATLPGAAGNLPAIRLARPGEEASAHRDYIISTVGGIERVDSPLKLADVAAAHNEKETSEKGSTQRVIHKVAIR